MKATRYAKKLNKGLFCLISLALLLALVLPVGDAGMVRAQPNGVTITDSFEDETKIASKESVAVDTAAGQVKLDPVLSATYGGAHYDSFWSVCADGDYIYAAGNTYSEGEGDEDALLVKFNKADLSIASRKVYGGADVDRFWSVYADGDYIYAAGYTRSGGQGGEDALLVKFNKGLASGTYRRCGFTFQDSGLTLTDSGLTLADSGLTLADSGLTLNDSGLTLAYSGLTLQSCHIYTSGILSSANLLSGQTVTSAESFGYEASSIPSGTSLKVQFSQENTNWYNAAGTLNGWDTLSAGSHSIDLSSLNWSGANFYYKMEFTSDGGDTPVLDEISVTASGAYPPVGGEAYPVNKLGVLAPWIGLAALLVGSISWFALRRRRTQN